MIQNWPSSIGFHENLGRVYQALGRQEQAAAEFEIVRRLRTPGAP